MSFFIHVYSGLNNKLIPLLSLLRIAKKENKNIKCYWGRDAYLSKSLFDFYDLFENIKEIDFISSSDFLKEYNNKNNIVYNKSGSCRDRNEIIYKTRYNIIYKGKKWEVDQFHKQNKGLWIAEIELESEEESFDVPKWVLEEVTGDEKYYNSNLSKHPYNSWQE